MGKSNFLSSRRTSPGNRYRCIIAIILPILAAFSLCYYQNKAHAIRRSVDELIIIAEAYEGQVYLFLDKLKRRAEDFASDGLVKTLLRRREHVKAETHCHASLPVRTRSPLMP